MVRGLNRKYNLLRIGPQKNYNRGEALYSRGLLLSLIQRRSFSKVCFTHAAWCLVTGCTLQVPGEEGENPLVAPQQR